MLTTDKNVFYSIYKSHAEYKDKQSVAAALFIKLINKGTFDFESKRSKQVIFRFRTKVSVIPPFITEVKSRG